MRVLILGSGPAGLIAAQAASQLGIEDIVILSKKRKSELFGAQYLHVPIPEATQTAPVQIRYRLIGSPEQYRKKVYGNNWNGFVSPEELNGNHLAWDIRETYDFLWKKFEGAIEDVIIDPIEINHSLLRLRPAFTFSTIPLPSICIRSYHKFQAEYIWAMGDAPARDQIVPVKMFSNSVLCNSLPSPSWYRVSRIFDHSTIEWPWGAKEIGDLLDKASPVTKPLKTDCHCWPSIVKIGRYGKWEKGEL